MEYKLIKSGKTVDGCPTYKTHIDNIFIMWEDKNRGLLKIFNTDVPIRDIRIFTEEVLESEGETKLIINEFADQMDIHNANPMIIFNQKKQQIDILVEELNQAVTEWIEIGEAIKKLNINK